MVVNNYRLAVQDNTHKDPGKKRRWFILKWTIVGIALLLIGAALGLLLYEARTSTLQAREVSSYAATLTYKVDKGPSNAIVYPKNGPFDKRLGYALLPQFLERMQSRGMQVDSQTRFSPELMQYSSNGFFTPYTEKTQTGLNIKDDLGQPVYSFSYPRRIYAAFDSVPPLVVQSLLFIENRGLLNQDKPYMNPAVDWVRFSKASIHELGKRVGLEYNTIGGSTLATQIEKFRHSPGGITDDALEKMHQMVSASVRAYRLGPQTMHARKDLVLSYVNTVPLSGAPGYGEVHGIGDGLHVWFDADMHKVNKLLTMTDAKGDTLQAKAQALRQVLSLMIAQRRPSYYLGEQGRKELNDLTGGYLKLLASNNYISPELRDAGLAQEVQFRDFGNNPAVAPKDTDKGALIARTHLSNLLGKTLYDLDRMDLAATTTLHYGLQEQITNYLKQLNDADFADEAGVLGKRMLSPTRTQAVHYSFTLFERTPRGNLVRVQTDNTDQPFDLNEGSKLELGSTAKLRVLATYLEIIAEVHQKYENASPQALRAALNEHHDNLSKFVLYQLLGAKDKSLKATLVASLERRYSASPYEAFFTGGGIHHFSNYRNQDNGRRPTVREAFQKSINLPFVRIMRDVVNYTINKQVGSSVQLLADVNDPRRKEYLQRFADKEGKTYLRRFWNKYENKNADERFEKLLQGLYKDDVRLAAVHRYLYPETDYATFSQYLRQHLPGEKIKEERVLELYERYGPEAYNLPDQGYIAKTHPLELWLLSYLRKHPAADWQEVVTASEPQRQEVYKWLFRTRYKKARDSRIRTILELDAYDDIQKRWARLGYPFGHLVPSLATALGSSGDRPEALAELMGIILNNGELKRTIRIEELQFAKLTPYETVVSWKPLNVEQVMNKEVAAVLKEALTEVVDVGTARRLHGGFMKADGTALVMGGKTGTGDNRYVTMSSRGYRLASRAVNRTATFVFFLGENHFGTLTAFVPGREAEDFKFTSSLPVQVLRGMEPILIPYLDTAAQDSVKLVSQPADASPIKVVSQVSPPPGK